MDNHRDYFSTAYRTGSDIWTHIPYQHTALATLPHLAKDSIVLDVGSGRGVWAFTLEKLGYRVIGVDYVKEIIDKANERAKKEQLTHRVRFLHGDALSLPFTDESFSMVTDIGFLQHITKDDWQKYVTEIMRVIPSKGFILNVSLSRSSARFMDAKPRNMPDGNFEKFGLHYYFFTEEEIRDIFQAQAIVLDQKIRYFDTRTDPEDGIALLFTLLQKK